jgi:FtsH-binding integral membrane protein
MLHHKKSHDTIEMPGCPYFLANTFSHLFSGLLLTALSAENSVAGDLSQKPLTHILFFLFMIGLLFILMETPVGPVKYVLFAVLCFLLGQNLSGLEQRLKQKNLLMPVLFYTSAVFIAMVAIGFYDSQNLLGWGVYLSAALFALLFAMLFSALFIEDAGTRASASMWIARLVTALFSIYVAFDVQVLKENAKLCRGEPDYINESLSLYLDILNLFTGIGGSSD